MKKCGFMFVAMLSLVAQSALADWLGLASGRTANLDNAAAMSVEGGVRLNGDIKLFGARFNFKASPDILVFADAGQYDRDGFSSGGTVFGAGAVYQFRGLELLANTDFAVRGVFHTGSLGIVDVSELGVVAIISGDQLADTNLAWYGNAGIHSIKTEVSGFFFGESKSSELVIGGGVTGSLSFGEWYAGIDVVDEVMFGAGVRYNLD